MLITGVVMALGITEIISGWGQVIRSNATIKLDWLHMGWSMTFLFGYLGYWIGMWAYAEVPLVYVGQSLFLVLPTLLMVLVTFAITPVVPMQGQLNMRSYYMSKRKPIFVTAAIAGLMSQLADYVIAGYAVPLWVLGGIVLVVAPAFTKALWVHALALAIYSAFVLFTYAPTMDQMSTRFTSTALLF